MTNLHIGASFDDFLAEEGILEEVEAIAIERILARQVTAAIAGPEADQEADGRPHGHQPLGPRPPARPDNTSVTLRTLQKAASTVGRRLWLELVQVKSSAA